MKIVMINPNSSKEMTAAIQAAAEKFAEGRFAVQTLATEGAPAFIDYFEDHAQALPGMIRIIRDYEAEADAFIIACHCDPNLKIMKQITNKPVIGIGEASMYMAAMLGGRFTVLSTDPHSVPHKQDLIHEYGLDHFCASVRVTDPAIQDQTLAYIDAGRKALQEDYAEVIVLGCAGMCELTDALTQALQMPVLDGIICALIQAEGLVHARLSTSKVRLYAPKAPQTDAARMD